MTQDPELEPDDATLVRHEQELGVGTTAEQAGAVHARKRLEAQHVEELVDREYEDADLERIEASENDSGEVETLPDGSISIPILEEELVITKRTVVRERLIVRKRTVTEQQRVEADLLRERVEIEADPGVEVTEARPQGG
jgi:uncharacterized protein (TIGR02271 family)